jgi:hypothetical protein
MGMSQFTVGQISSAFRLAERGVAVAGLCRERGTTDRDARRSAGPFDRWLPFRDV